jgi:hypothetical protein
MMLLFGKANQCLAWQEAVAGVPHKHVLGDPTHQRFSIATQEPDEIFSARHDSTPSSA